MARTIDEIKAVINNQIAADSNLTALDSTSNTAFKTLWINVVSFAHWILEGLFDVHIFNVAATMEAKEPATLKWYQKQALKFQNGYELVWNDTTNKWEYETIDADAQIVSYASVVETGEDLIIKVAKEVNNEPSFLLPSEKTAVEAYYKKIKTAGTQLIVTSFTADDLLCDYTIYYNPEIFTASTASAAVVAAVKSYLKALSFDGTLSLNDLQDAIETITGITEVKKESVQARPSGGTYAEVDVRYISDAGYLLLDAASDIYNTSNYVADV